MAGGQETEYTAGSKVSNRRPSWINTLLRGTNRSYHVPLSDLDKLPSTYFYFPESDMKIVKPYAIDDETGEILLPIKRRGKTYEMVPASNVNNVELLPEEMNYRKKWEDWLARYGGK